MAEKREYLVRQYDPNKDLEGATRCMIEGFDHILWPIYRYAEGVAERAVKFSAKFADKFYVAEVDGEARGMLVGSYMDTRALYKAGLYGFTDILTPFMMGKFKLSPFARINVARLLLGFAPLAYKHPLKPHASETVLLTSQKDYRGGIGKAMMSAWVSDSNKQGINYSTVCTDSALSWDFYERFGFDRIVEFPQRAYHYSIPGEKHTAYIYRIQTNQINL